MDSSEVPPFGETLASFRVRARLSQQKLADKLGVSRGAVVGWERGNYLPRTRDLVLEMARQLRLGDDDAALLLRAALLDPAPVYWRVPYHRNPFFTGREEALQRLREALLPGKTAVLMQPQAISGLGGIGKTQTAVEYAYRHRQDYQAIFWLQADSREILFREFIALAQVVDLPEQDEQDQLRAVAAMRRWLLRNKKWLLILDNIEDLSSVEEFVPSGHYGSILLTTRASVTEPVAYASELGAMTEQEGVLFLLQRTKILALHVPISLALPAHYALAKQIWDLLGGFPLALDQAGAYALETGCGFSGYLDLYQQRHTELLERRGRFSSGHNGSVTATFLLSLERVRQHNTAAIALLRCCAFLHPDAIPEELIVQGVPALGSELQMLAESPTAFDEMMEALLVYSLVQRTADGKTFSLHRLVQVVLKDEMGDHQRRLWAERAVRALASVFPDPAEVANWPQCERYILHGQICAASIESYRMAFPEALRVLNQVGRYLYRRGQYKEAIPFHQKALSLLEQEPAANAVAQADCLKSLAGSFFSLGKYAQAEQDWQRALTLYEQALGLANPEVAHILNNLAELYRVQGKYDHSEQLHMRALVMRQQTLGPTHLDVAQSLLSLAVLYRSLGDYEQAVALSKRALSIREQVLGPTHSEVAHSLNNLALLYHQQGKYEQMEPLLQRALSIQEQQLGHSHPDVAETLNNLVLLYYQQGKYGQVETLLQRALAIREEAWGAEHPRVATILNNLAELYRTQGKYAEAESLCQRALAIWERAHGPTHSYTAHALNNLAEIYRVQGKYEQAGPLYRRALAAWEQALGSDHPNVAMSLHNLAQLHYAQGEYEQAKVLYQRALSIWESKLGPDHDHVAICLSHLAELYGTLGEYEQAETCYLRALPVLERVLGAEHPDVVAASEKHAAFQKRWQEIRKPES